MKLPPISLALEAISCLTVRSQDPKSDVNPRTRHSVPLAYYRSLLDLLLSDCLLAGLLVSTANQMKKRQADFSKRL